MKQLKTLILITLVLLCTGCASSLGKITDEDITYDMTKGFNINDVVSNVSEGTDVAYTIDEDNNKIIITLTNGDKTETIEKDITIEKPVIEVSDGITYDTYTKETDVDDHITKPDTATYEYTIDEDNSTITINFTDGEYKETIDKTIELTNSDPRPGYPWVYNCTDSSGLGIVYKVVFYENGSSEYNGFPGVYNESAMTFPEGDSWALTFSDDYKNLRIDTNGYFRNGTKIYDTCTLQ